MLVRATESSSAIRFVYRLMCWLIVRRHDNQHFCGPDCNTKKKTWMTCVRSRCHMSCSQRHSSLGALQNYFLGVNFCNYLACTGWMTCPCAASNLRLLINLQTCQYAYNISCKHFRMLVFPPLSRKLSYKNWTKSRSWSTLNPNLIDF